MCRVLLMIRCKLSWEAQLTEFDAAHVGGTPGLVAFDLVRVSLRDAVRRAVETGADHLAALGLLARGIITFDLGGVVEKSEPVRAVDGVAVKLVRGYTQSSGAVRIVSVRKTQNKTQKKI